MFSHIRHEMCSYTMLEAVMLVTNTVSHSLLVTCDAHQFSWLSALGGIMQGMLQCFCITMCIRYTQVKQEKHGVILFCVWQINSKTICINGGNRRHSHLSNTPCIGSNTASYCLFYDSMLSPNFGIHARIRLLYVLLTSLVSKCSCLLTCTSVEGLK